MAAMIGYIIPMRQNRAEGRGGARRAAAAGDEARRKRRTRSRTSLKTAEIELLIGKQLSTKLIASHQELAFRMGKMRKKFATQYGFVVPEVR
jgi:flagellar biosynthesis protein FlhA